MADRNAVVVGDDRCLADRMHAEDAHLGVVEDRRGEQASDRTEARDRERGSRELLARGPTRARGIGEPLDLGGDVEQAEPIRVVHHGHEEALIGGRGHADAVALLHHDARALLVEHRVDDRIALEPADDRLDDERQIRELHPLLRRRTLGLIAHLDEPADVDLLDVGVVHRRRVRLLEALRDATTHAAERDLLVGLWLAADAVHRALGVDVRVHLGLPRLLDLVERFGRSCHVHGGPRRRVVLGAMREHVGLGDAAAVVAHAREIDSGLAREGSRGRGGEHATIPRRHGRRRGRARGRGHGGRAHGSCGLGRHVGDRRVGCVAEERDHLTDLRDRPLGRDVLRDLARERRRDLDRGLVRHHLDERLVRLHGVAGLLEPTDDLAFDDTLTDRGQLELDHGCSVSTWPRA